MIELKDIHKSFDDRHVLRGVNLTVEKGQSLVVIGGSGSGKSVLLKHIIGLLQPDNGTVLINNQDISAMDEDRLNEYRKKFGGKYGCPANNVDRLYKLFSDLCEQYGIATRVPQYAPPPSPEQLTLF